MNIYLKKNTSHPVNLFGSLNLLKYKTEKKAVICFAVMMLPELVLWDYKNYNLQKACCNNWSFEIISLS